MNMLKSSGLKIPGRGPKHSSPVGRTTTGPPSSPAPQKDNHEVSNKLYGSRTLCDTEGRHGSAPLWNSLSRKKGKHRK
ncbi:CAP-Gly domain-containing linker protein 2 isoform X1 [Tachysurus ichikawai]